MQRASIPAKAKLMTSSGMGRANGKSWEDEVIDFDRNGPGLLGYYLDMVALMASLVPFIPEELNHEGRWVRSEDPVLAVIASAWRGHLPQITQSELIYKAVRLRESVGRCWHIADPDLGWCVVGRATPQQDDAKSVVWRTMYGTDRKTPGDRVYYSWVGDSYDDWMTISPCRRALPDLRRIRAAQRNQTRTSNSRLLTNGLLAFPDGDMSTARPLASPENDDGTETELTGIDKLIDDFLDVAKLGFADDDSPAANIPFPYIGQKAEWVELGGNIDPTSLESERAGIEGFARAVNFPQKLLTEGPGDANHWNEYLLKEDQVKLGLAPKVNPVAAEVTGFHFRPVIKLLSGSPQLGGAWRKVPNRCRLVPDYDYLLERPKQASEILAAYTQAGAASRQEVADAYGIKDKLDLPRGMSEFEFWELINHVSGAPYAETDIEGNLIVPEPPVDPTAAGFGLGAPPAAPALPAGDPTGTPPAADAPVTEPTPPAAVAAASTPDDQPQEDPNDIYDWAEREDQRLEGKLSGTAAAVVAAITAEIARQVIVATPQRSPQRAALRALPVEKVWCAASDDARSKVDPNQVAADVAAKHRQQIKTSFNESNESMIRKWGPVLATAITADAIASGVAAFIGALLPWYTAHFDVGTVASAKVHATVARSAMAVAGGAQADASGAMTVSAGNTPIPEKGGEWQGNLGFTTGHSVVDALTRKYGRPIEWQWIHGFYGEPETPYPPHVDLDRKRFPSPSAVPGGYHILDHKGCRCGWRLKFG